jgi:hypothetical protein
MSEYQYYEFRAIDRPLDGEAQRALRAISSRARITATSFVNEYEWGDLKGDPRDALAALTEPEKVELLLRAAKGDPHVAVEIGRLGKKPPSPPSSPHRTAGALRGRAQAIAQARQAAAAQCREAERRRQAAQAERTRRARLDALRQRGAEVWREVEAEIARRNPSSYDKAAGLLLDLRALAAADGSQDDFDRRLASIRTRHEKKGRFIERLDKLGCGADPGT